MQKKFLFVGIIVIIVIIAGIAAAIMFMEDDEPESSPEFVNSNLNINKHNVLANDTVRVTIDANNQGTKEGDYAVSLLLDNMEYQNQTVHLLINEKKTLSFNVSSPIEANHTVQIGVNSTYFNVLPRYSVGDYLKLSIIGYIEMYGQVDATITTQITAVTSTNYTTSETFEGLPLPPSTYTYEFSDPPEDYGTFIGNEMTSTTYGLMNLAHYREINGTEVTDTYRGQDGPTFIVAYNDGSNTIWTMTLTETNMAWIKELPIQ
jgi:hypothetical protein